MLYVNIKFKKKIHEKRKAFRLIAINDMKIQI